ncbi:MAG: TY-Chap2 family putative peptide chaperone [Planctomycetales bacterium]
MWRDALSAEDQSKTVDGICRRIGLTVPTNLPACTPVVLAYRFVAEFLSGTAFDRSRWECRSGFLDSSGFEGCIIRTKLFDAFPGAEERLQVRTEDDFLENSAYRFWFILRNSEPVLCLETTGTIWNLGGDSLNIPKTYQVRRRLWPLITEIAGDLLP